MSASKRVSKTPLVCSADAPAPLVGRAVLTMSMPAGDYSWHMAAAGAEAAPMPAAVVTVPTVDALMAQHIERMRLEQATATQEADAAAERAQEELYTKEAIFLWQRGVYERRPSMQRTMRELLTLSCSVYLNAEQHPEQQCRSLGACACKKVSLAPNEQFLDVESGGLIKATGMVFMCRDSGRMHVCTRLRDCPLMQLTDDEQALVCPFSGFAMATLIARHPYAVYHPSDTLAAAVGGRAGARRGNRQQTAAEVVEQMRNKGELVSWVRQMLSSEKYVNYWGQKLAANREALMAATWQVIKRTQTPPELYWLRLSEQMANMQIKAERHHALFERLPPLDAGDNLAVRNAQVLYFAQCIYVLLHLLPETAWPALRVQQNNRVAMSLMLLYLLADGLKIEVRYRGDVVVRDDDAYGDDVHTEHIEFVPQHLSLRRMLPPEEFALELKLLPGTKTDVLRKLKKEMVKGFNQLVRNAASLAELRRRTLAMRIPLQFLG